MLALRKAARRLCAIWRTSALRGSMLPWRRIPMPTTSAAWRRCLTRFRSNIFIWGRKRRIPLLFSDLLDALQAQGIQPTIPAPGDTLAFDSGATLTFLGPADDVPDGNLNDRSLITLFQADEQKVLLMGDAESAAEQSLLAHYPSLRCDVLKVGHHGGATSSSLSFLQTISTIRCRHLLRRRQRLRPPPTRKRCKICPLRE